MTGVQTCALPISSWIDSLKENEIFVFGSNLAGMHGGGAARIARLHFGAVMGKGVGLQGQSYAIPTMQGGVETIRPYVDDFIAYAKHHQELHFLVTPIGCGIAGFEAEDIAPLFEKAKEMKNISISFKFNETTGRPDCYLNGELVEKEIRSLEVSNHVSPIAAVPFVREALVEQQQKMGEDKGIVMDGRDIGTTVFPNAELKIFVTASSQVRAQRRFDELKEKGMPADFDATHLSRQQLAIILGSRSLGDDFLHHRDFALRLVLLSIDFSLLPQVVVCLSRYLHRSKEGYQK